jgi:hypothetical protein
LSSRANKATADMNVDSALRLRERSERDKHADTSRMDVGMLQSSGGNRAVNALLAGGAPLEPKLRSDMEARFGADFTDVRIHDDPGAHDAAAGIGAKAYTRGNDIAFADRRFLPGTRDGRKLLAHELAHVVQQRRGGATPVVDPSAAHEQGASAAAEQAASGAPSVNVAGATGVGIAREPDDDKRRKKAPAKQSKAKPKPSSKSTTSNASIYPDSPFKSTLGEEEYSPAIRMLSPGPEYWLNHIADPSSLPWHQLVDEANAIDEWCKRQTGTSPQLMRMEQIRDAFRREAELQAKNEGEPAKPQKAAKKGSAKGKGKGKGAPAPVSTEPKVDDRPRALREHSSIDTSDPQVLQQEYDEIMKYLQRKDIPAVDRKTLQLELATLTPQLDQVLAQRAQLRHAEDINRAIMPSTKSDDGLEDLKAIAANIDNIKPLSDKPGFSYVMRGSEMVVMKDEEAAAIRSQMSANLEKSRTRIRDANDQVDADWNHTWKLNYEEHPWVGFLVSEWSGEDTMDLQKKYEPHIDESIGGLSRYRNLQKSNGSLKAQADAIADAARASAEARMIYDEGVGRQIEYAGKWVDVFDKAKTAGKFAANIAAPGLGGAIYAGGEDLLVQGVEMHYGQRESFDFGAIAIDAAANYVGGKVTSGVLGLPGPGASLGTRALTWVAADRAGSVAGAWTHMGLEQATGRSDYSASDYFHTGWKEATDWKQTIVNAGVGIGAHYAHSGQPGRTGGEESSRGKRRPIAEESKPKAEEQKPIAEETKPKAEEQKPIAEEAKPKAEEQKPIAEETKPKVDEAKPKTNEAPPKADKAKPKSKSKGKGKGKSKSKRKATSKSGAGAGEGKSNLHDVEARLKALEAPPGEREQFEEAAKLVRETAAKDPAEAENLLDYLEERYGGEQRENSVVSEELADPKRQPATKRDASGKQEQSVAEQDRALNEQTKPHPKRVQQDRNKESEKLGEAGGRDRAEKEGIGITDWNPPQQFKGLFGRGIDALGLRGLKTIILEWKYGRSDLGTGRDGTVQMSNEWVGRKIAELEMSGDVESARALLQAVDEGNLQGAVYWTRPLKRGETTTRRGRTYLQDRLGEGNENISESGLITYSPTKVRAAYEARRADLVDALWHKDWSVLRAL